jgi:hypothetical protein
LIFFNKDSTDYYESLKRFWSFIKPVFPFIPALLSNYRARLIERVIIEMAYGEITLDESIFLGKIIRKLKTYGPIIEIGTLFGRSTLVITANKTPDQKLITVDNYSWNSLGLKPSMHFKITNNILSEAAKNFNLEILQMNKNDFYLTYKGDSPSLVFLDAIHNYAETKADILWAKQVNAHLICGHDYDEQQHPAVVKAVKEFGGPRKLFGSIWVL